MKYVWTAALLAVAMTMGAWAQGTMPNTDPKKVLLNVNGEPLYAGAVNLVMASLRADVARGTTNKMAPEELAKQAMERAVDSMLLAQEARRRGVKPDTAKVDAQIQQLEKQVGGKEKFEGMLSQSGTTPDIYREAMIQMDLINGMIKKDIEPNIKVTDEEVQKFYDDNPSYFLQPEEVKASHILIKVPQDATPEQKAEAKKKAEALQKRAAKGEDFATLAKENSEGPSAKNGGELGYFAKQQMVKPFADAAFALKPGQISDVVETRFGYHVIKVEDKKAASKMPLDEKLKARIRDSLQKQKVGEAMRGVLSQLQKDAKIKSMAPAPAAGAPAEKK